MTLRTVKEGRRGVREWRAEMAKQVTQSRPAWAELTAAVHKAKNSELLHRNK